MISAVGITVIGGTSISHRYQCCIYIYIYIYIFIWYIRPCEHAWTNVSWNPVYQINILLCSCSYLLTWYDIICDILVKLSFSKTVVMAITFKIIILICNNREIVMEYMYLWFHVIHCLRYSGRMSGTISWNCVSTACIYRKMFLPVAYRCCLNTLRPRQNNRDFLIPHLQILLYVDCFIYI